MSLTHRTIRAGILALAPGCLLAANPAEAVLPASHPLVRAVHHGDCDNAVRLVNPDATQNDADTAFIAGRMLDEGLCVRQNSLSARQYYARAADLGDSAAELEYAAKTGLGTGGTQSYEQAGILCRQGGLDGKSTVPTYDLGYACTVGSVAAQLLRQSLPKGAFRPGSGPLIVEFTPGTGALRVQSTPRVGFDEVRTGSNLRVPLIDANVEVQKAWRQALAQVPAPDASRLGPESLALPLDVDMTLEIGRTPAGQSARPLSDGFMSGDSHRGLAP
jgi:hypothetical protein